VESDVNEDELLRSAALQNASSILRARQRAEAALARRSEELAHALAMVRATLESTTDGILVTDDQGVVTDFNAKYVETWRLSPEITATREHSKWIAAIAPQLADPAGFLEHVREITVTRPKESFHLLETVDGRILERQTKIQRIGDRAVGRVWSLRDITSRVQAEETLRRQQEWFRVTLSSIGDAVITTDIEARVTFLNPVAEKMTGWKTDDARGQPLEKVFIVINERTREPAPNPVTRALREGAVVGLAHHTALIARNGKTLAIEDSAAPIRSKSGQIIGAVTVFHDVTSRRKEEADLQYSERILADFFENAAIGLHWIAPDGTILRANRAELAMLGYSQAEFVGHKIGEFQVEGASAAERNEKPATAQASGERAARLRCKDGSIKDVLVSSNELWEDGEFVHTRCFVRDITEQKRGDTARARLAAVVESSDDAILSKSLDGVIQTWNRGAQEMFGYTAEEIVGTSVLRLIPAEYKSEEAEILRRLNLGERIDHYQTVRQRKDGSKFDVSLTVSPIRDARGTIIGAAKIARDITGPKRAEAALRASEEHFRQLADAMPQLVWTARRDGFVDYYNRQWYEYTGLAKEAPGDGDWIPAVHPEDRDRCLAAWRKAIHKKELFQIEYRLKNRLGDYRWHLGRAALACDAAGAPIRWYGSSTDIHEQKMTAEALREESAINERLNAVAMALATELDLGKIVQIITDSARQATRAEFAAFFRNRVDEEGAFYTPADGFERFPLSPSTEFLETTFSGTGVIRLDDVRNDPRFGQDEANRDKPAAEAPIVSYLAVPVFARSGEVLGGLFLGHGQPGIFRKRDETTLVALAAQAAAAMETARLYQAEMQARAAAESANHTKDDFLAALSHELRTPLTPILAILSSISEETVLPSAVAADLTTVRRNIELETRLIDDLLDLTRITRGKLELHRERVVVSELIESALTTCLPDMKDKQVHLVRDIDGRARVISADNARLTQVLWNLLKNAVKFTPAGGTITIRTRVKSEGDGRLGITIEDTGIGIEPSSLGRIFDAFEQGNRKITQQFGGLGLGLAISKAIVEAHGGTIEAASAGPGQGSAFTLMLPLKVTDGVPLDRVSVAETHPSATEEAGKAASRSRPLRILLVEDHRDTSAVLVKLLGRNGHKVIHAPSIEKASEIAEQESRSEGLDLVISDLGLPDGSGLDLMRMLSATYGLRGIALSGYGMESDREESSAAGFVCHLTKPVDIAILRKAIAELSEAN
jgi:PAS domain S-box-containing protein